MNREAWLTELSQRVRPVVFKDFRVAKFRVTCGWPCRMALSPTKTRIGECHGAASSADGHFEIFISPLLAKPIDVADVLVHEMTHVVAGMEAAHGKGFTKIAHHIGLTRGKPQSAGMGKRLKERVEQLLESLGAYPHAAMKSIPKVDFKKESSIVSLVCECGCKIMMGRKILDSYGAPTCICSRTFLPQER